MKNQVQLITYVDRLSAGDIQALRHLLTQGALAGVFGGVHLLPFFHRIDGADAGFDPIDHLTVDARLGSWADISELAGDIDVMADVIVNHVSCESPEFTDFLCHGDASPYAGMFLEPAQVFGRPPTAQDWSSVYRPRPTPAFTPFTFADGTVRVLWTSFTAQQVDINVQHPKGREYLDNILIVLAKSGVKMIRLDAVGYAIKKAGSSCFMMDETFAYIEEFANLARSRGLEVLVEVHSYYQRQIEIAQRVDWVYDFALPPLVLHAIFFKTGQYLHQWGQIRPANALTVLDTHDGIGIIDIGADPSNRQKHPGLVPNLELDALVERIHANSHGQSREATGAAASNLDLYQVNCTFYEALGRDDNAYLLARLVQFFLPGIPQVYYVGLLAGLNDMDLLHRSRVGRDINRHYYSAPDLEAQLARPVVKRLLDWIRWRNSHPAFQGRFSIQLDPSNAAKLSMSWHHGDAFARLELDFERTQFKVDASSLPAPTHGVGPR
jgi:sucrose phosphorylase